jgi:hypothetical protein
VITDGATARASRTTGDRLRGLAARLALPALAVGVLYVVRPGVVENGLRSPRLWLVAVGVVLAARLVSAGVRRVTGRSRAAAVASNALIAVAVIALLAPSFSQRELDEPLGATVGAGASALPTSSGAAAPQELSSARLEGVGHAASGATRFVDVDGQVVLRFEDVDVEGTPGPYVHLVPVGSRTPDGGVPLGPLKAERGSFGYVVPADVDVGRSWTVLVWCRPFATPVAASDHTPG